MSYVIHSDRECARCGDVHGYLTRNCNLNVYVHRDTALMVCVKHRVPSVNIEAIAPGVDLADLCTEADLGAYNLIVTKAGKPDERYPTTMPRR